MQCADANYSLSEAINRFVDKLAGSDESRKRDILVVLKVGAFLRDVENLVAAFCAENDRLRDKLSEAVAMDADVVRLMAENAALRKKIDALLHPTKSRRAKRR
jgi:hypothetical protein